MQQPSDNETFGGRSGILSECLLGLPLLTPSLTFWGTVETHRATLCLLMLPFILWTALHRPRLAWPRGLTGWLLGGWLLWSVVATVFAVQPAVAVYRQAVLGCVGLYGLSALILFRHRPAAGRRALAVLAAGFMVALLRLVLQWISLENPAAFDWRYHLDGFGHLRHLSLFGAPALLAAAAFLLPENSNRHRDLKQSLGMLVVLTLCWAVLCWAGGRGGLLAAAFGCMVLVLASRGPDRVRLGGKLVIPALLGALLSLLFAVNVPAMGLFRIPQQMDLDSGMNAVASNRLVVWGAAWQAILEHPLTGLGPGNYNFSRHPTLIFQPHNIYVQSAMEWGLVGALLFWGTLATLVVKALKNSETWTDPARRAALSIIAALLLYGFFDGSLHFIVPLVGFALALAILLRPVKSAPAEAKGFFRPVAFGGVLAVGAVMLFYIYLYAAMLLFRPQPDALEPRLVRAFPMTTFNLWSWTQAWEQEAPEAAEEWYEWARHESEWSWHFARLQCFFELRKGDVPKARELAQEAVVGAPIPQKQLIQFQLHQLLPPELQLSAEERAKFEQRQASS